MSDTVERLDVLKVVEEFREGIFHDENLTKDNEHDWEAAYCMQKLYYKLCRLPKSPHEIATQIVKRFPWEGEYHTYSKCKKIVPFIDWCQPFCSGCGAEFKNYRRWVAKEAESEEAEKEQLSTARG
jgi:hypothetical protein